MYLPGEKGRVVHLGLLTPGPCPPPPTPCPCISSLWLFLSSGLHIKQVNIRKVFAILTNHRTKGGGHGKSQRDIAETGVALGA